MIDASNEFMLAIFLVNYSNNIFVDSIKIRNSGQDANVVNFILISHINHRT